MAVLICQLNKTLIGRGFRAECTELLTDLLRRIYEELLAFLSRLSTIGLRPKQQIA